MSLSKQAIQMYKSAKKVARHIVNDKTQIEYAFVFTVEDQKHGGDAVGIHPVTCKTTMLMSEHKVVYVMLPRSVEREMAFAGCEAANLRCQLMISLPEYHHSCSESLVFQSRAFEQVKGDPDVYKVTIEDTTPRALDTKQSVWELTVRTRAKSPLVIESLVFAHNPEEHAELMDELYNESLRYETPAAYKLLDLCTSDYRRPVAEDGTIMDLVAIGSSSSSGAQSTTLESK